MNKRLISRPNTRGFSLIATLCIMLLLFTVLMGMVSLSSTVKRDSDQNKNMVVARANARLALMLAIADLQKYAGPDQRVTANAEIGSAANTAMTNTKWTGVWSTTALNDVTKPMVGGNTDLSAMSGYSAPNGAYFTDRRNLDPTLQNNQWKQKLRLVWLVSGNPDPAMDPTTSEQQITMVEKSAGLSKNEGDPLHLRVTAPLVSLNNGAYAYWVGDESQKARIDQAPSHVQGTALKQPNKTDPADGGYSNLLGSAGPNFNDIKVGTDNPYEDVMNMPYEDRWKLLTSDTLSLFTEDKKVKTNFHDFTTDSLGVISDVREGGLKKDLTPYLETTGDIVSDTTVLPTREIGGSPVNPGLTANQPLLIGPYFKEFGPKFAQMRNWAALRSKTSGSAGSAVIDPQYPPSTTMTGTNTMPLDQVVDLTTSAQAVHPFITRYTMNVDFSLDTSRAGGLALRTHVYPRVTLWNPYNVTIKGARYLIVARGMHEVPGLKFGGKAAINIAGDPNSGRWCPPFNDYSNYYFFVTDPVDFAPGECLVFVPDVNKSSGPLLGSNASQYHSTDFSKNVLSATVPPGKGASNFYFQSGKQVDPTATITPSISYTCGGTFSGAKGITGVCTLKKTNGSTGSIAISNVFNNADTSALQWINVCQPGGNGNYYWSRASGRTLILTPYEANDDRVPPTDWAQEMRQINFIESGHSANKPASTFAHNNMRPAMAHRSPFCESKNYWDVVAGNFHDMQQPNINLRENTFTMGYDGKYKLRGSPFSANPINHASISSYPLFDIPCPNYPLLSLANLQHVQFSYQAWQPSFVLGHSICDIRTHRDASVDLSYFNNAKRWESPFGDYPGYSSGRWYEMLQMDKIITRKNEILQYDSAFMVNQNLWDRFYLSGIPYGNYGGSVTWDPLSGEPLPNSRLVLNPFRSGSDTDMTTKIGTSATTTPFDYSSYYFMNKGAFNINSVSVQAWKAFFSSLNTVQRPPSDSGGSPVLAVFSRFLVPPSDKVPTKIFNDNGAWNGMDPLTTSEIDNLAIKMVEVVKARGPFLGLADFVNRRLGPSGGAWNYNDPTLMGPLQAAIESASATVNHLNYKLANPAAADDSTNPRPTARLNEAYTSGLIQEAVDVNSYYQWKQYGAAGLMNQADILQALAPCMTARGDTFVVRAYGEARDASGKVTAKAWCEAVVQRTPDYLLSTVITKKSDATGNNPMEPLTVRSKTENTWMANDSGDEKIHPINQRFGRKFVITKFRWLNPSEV